MGLFGKSKKNKEETGLADNEFKFNMLPFTVLSIEGNQLKHTQKNKKGKLLAESTFNLKRVDKLSHGVAGGNFYKIIIKFLDEDKPFSFRYDTKKEQEQADKFLNMLRERIG